MKLYYLCILLVIVMYHFSCTIFVNEMDDDLIDYYKSELIFDDTKVHEYRIFFYAKHWQDTLEHYYSVSDTDRYLPAALIYGDNEVMLDSVGVRFKGFSSYIGADFPKKPYKIDFNVFKDHTFFGVDKLNFSNAYKDPSFIREKIAYDVIGKYIPAPRAAFANLYIKWVGDPSSADSLIGLYTQIEQVEGRFLQQHFNDNSGNLYKSEMANLIYWGDNISDYKREFSLKTNEYLDDWSGLITMVERLNKTPDSLFSDTIVRYLNIDRCISYLALNMVLSNFDSYACSGRNFYLYDDPASGIFTMIPWDMNMAFGTFTKTNWDPVAQDIDSIHNMGIKILFKKIVENEKFKQDYLDRIREMIEGPCSYSAISQMADQLKSLLAPHVEADKHKLYSTQDFQSNIENDIMDSTQVIPGIKSFSQKRNENIIQQLSESLLKG